MLKQLKSVFRRLHANSYPIFSNIATGTHDGYITVTLKGNVAQPYLVAQIESDGKASVSNQTALPIGTFMDSGKTGDRVSIALFGTTKSTQLMVANSSLSAFKHVYVTADGYINNLSNSAAAAGGYYNVGLALKSASAKGDLVEVVTHSPVPTAVLPDTFTARDTTVEQKMTLITASFGTGTYVIKSNN